MMKHLLAASSSLTLKILCFNKMKTNRYSQARAPILVRSETNIISSESYKLIGPLVSALVD